MTKQDKNTNHVDVVVLGAGAAGLMCAITAAKRGKSVTILEVSNKPGKKILMSGGGRCNFTNLEVSASNFICANPHFVKSALTQYGPWDFISMVAENGIAYHEKTHGQLFCDDSSKQILTMLLDQCDQLGIGIKTCCITNKVSYSELEACYQLSTNGGVFECMSLVVATGGLSIPTLGGASGLAYELAQQFDLTVTDLSASLVPFTLSGKWHELSQALSGVAVPVQVMVKSSNAPHFSESMLFTHRGLSGPAVLQLSNYWYLGDEIVIDLLPGQDLEAILLNAKEHHPNTTITQVLSSYLPKSLVAGLQPRFWPISQTSGAGPSLHSYKSQQLCDISHALHHWQLRPSGTEGYRTAEVTRGGIDVSAVSSKTMQVTGQTGLYFIGECLDVTGHLGGFNFQWAWSSGYVAGMNV